MTPAEVAKVLVKASAYDLRTVGETDVIAWHEALADIDFAEALIAVTVHFKDSTDRLMPAHIRRIVTARNPPKLGIGAPEIPPAVPLERRSANSEIEQLRAILPATRASILRRREWYEADRVRDRHLTAVPNPHFTAPPPADGHPVPDTEESA